MDITCMNECYKHRWLLDYVNQQIDLLSYQVTYTEQLENRIFRYVGKYLMQDEDNHKNKAFIKKMIAKKIKADLSHYRGIKSEQIEGSIDTEKGANLIDCWSNQTEKRLDKDFWIETLGGDNPKHRAIVSALANGYTYTETAKILTNKFGGKLNGNRMCIKRFRDECETNRDSLLSTLII